MESWPAARAIIARDTLRSLRLASTRFAFIGLLAVEFAVATAVVSNISYGGTVHEFAGAFAEAYARVALIIITIVGVSGAVSAPAQTIGLERRRDTWVMLRAAPMHSFELVGALVGGAMTAAMIPALMHAPFLVIALSWAEPSEALPTIAAMPLCAGILMTASAVGVLIAVILKRTEAAVSVAGVVFGMYVGGLHALLAFGFNTSGWTYEAGPRGRICNSILMTLRTISPAHQAYDITQGVTSTPGVAASTAGLAIIFVACFWGATRLVHREEPDVRRQPRAVRKRSKPNIGMATHRPFPDWINPIFVMEIRRCYLGRPVLAFIVLAGAFAVYLSLATLIASPAPAEPIGAIAWSCVSFVLPLILGMAVMAPMIARERDENTFDSIALTTRTPGEILRGKFAAGIAQLAPGIVLVLLSFAPFWILGGKHYAIVFAGTIALAVSFSLELAAGTFATVITRNARQSSLYSRLLSAALLMGFTVPVMIAMVIDDDYESLLPFTSPLVAFGKFVIDAGDSNRTLHLVATLLMFLALAVCFYFLSLRTFRRQLAQGSAINSGAD